MSIKKIGVLTSGGDAPGMNAAVRAVVRTALNKGVEVVGIVGGYTGLINGEIIDFNLRSVSEIIHRGGTVLYSSRCPEFKTEEGILKAVETCKKHGIDGIVTIGGDGTFRGARDLSLHGIPCVGIPATIDNDIASTDYTIGFDTAMNTVMEMVDRLRDTAQSHARCSVVEVMGRGAGYLALRTGIAVGAVAILVPEIEYNVDEIVERMMKTKKTGKKHFIIVVAEGIGKVKYIAKEIEDKTGIETRATVLGHVQRGGRPTVRDRVMASRMGYAAVELLVQGVGNRVISFTDNKIVDFDIYEALSMERKFDYELYDIAHEISI